MGKDKTSESYISMSEMTIPFLGRQPKTTLFMHERRNIRNILEKIGD